MTNIFYISSKIIDIIFIKSLSRTAISQKQTSDIIKKALIFSDRALEVAAINSRWESKALFPAAEQ